MDENYMIRLYNENKEIIDNDLLYNDIKVPNYEEQACCNNVICSGFGNNNIFCYISDICFKDIPLDEEEIISNISNFNREVKTPLCSNKKKLLTPDDIIVNNESNNNNNNNSDMINQNQNQNKNLIRNSLASNPSNDSAAEPIRPLRRNGSCRFG